MICLIKQDGAEIVSWFIGPTLASVAQQCDDDLLTKEIFSLVRRLSPGKHRLREGRYTLLIGVEPGEPPRKPCDRNQLDSMM
jgi:hypothetical protein